MPEKGKPSVRDAPNEQLREVEQGRDPGSPVPRDRRPPVVDQEGVMRAALEATVDHSHVHLAYLDREFNFVHVNQAYARGTGLDTEFLVGRNHFELFPDPENQVIFQQVADSGEPVYFEAKPFTNPYEPEAKTRYWDWSLVPVKDGQGQVQGLVLSLLDVTDREKATRDVHEREEAFRALAENAPVMIARTDREQRYLYVNPAVEKITGLPSHALLGKSLRDLDLPEEIWLLWERRTGDVLESGKPDQFQFHATGPDGDRYYDARLAPEFGPDGSVQSVLATVREITEQVRNQEQLETERARLKAVIDNAPEGIVVADDRCRIVQANPAAEQLFQRPIPYGEDLQSHGAMGLLHRDGTPYDPEDLPLTRSVFQGETVQNLEIDIRRPDGQVRNMLVSSAPIRDSAGEITGAVGVLQDITIRQQTRQLLERYAARLQFLNDVDRSILAAQSPQKIAEASLHRAQQLLKCTRISVASYNWTEQEATLLAVLTAGSTEVGQGETLSLEWDWFLDELARGKIVQIRDLGSLESPPDAIRILTSEGVQSIASVPLIAEGELIGSLNLSWNKVASLTPEQESIAREMASRLAIAIHQAQLHKEVERHADKLERSVVRRTAALRASEARFRTIFENATVGFALVDSRGEIVMSNPALQAMLGYSAEELQGMRDDQFIHPDDRQRRDELFQELMAGKRTQFKMEKRYIRKDGTQIWVHPTVSIVRTPRGSSQYAIKMVEDITEQRKAREALIQAERLTLAGQLGASLAHEINNPLQTVIGSLGLAREMLEAEDEAQLYLEIAIEELERAARIVSQLRDLNRKSDPAQRVPTQVNEIAEKVLRLSAKQCEAHQVEVIWRPAPAVPLTSIVPDRIRQVFLNLVLNAIQAMPGGGQLQVSTARTEEPDGVLITIADTGKGIAPDLLANLFEPFRSTRPEGLGLGLYISKSIVEEHGGRIEVESQADQGTTFTVWLPMLAGSR